MQPARSQHCLPTGRPLASRFTAAKAPGKATAGPLRCALLVALLALAGAPLDAALSSPGEASPQRIRFAKGQSSAVVAGRVEPDAGSGQGQEYVLHARAGQVLELRLASAAPDARLLVLCPRSARSGAVSTREGSFTLPQSGDYTLRVEAAVGGSTPRQGFAYSLTVAVASKAKAKPTAPEGVGGAYERAHPTATVDVRQLPDGRIEFSLIALSRYPESAPHTGDVSGVAALAHGTAVFAPPQVGLAQCTLTMHFTTNRLSIEQEGNDADCGFGSAVTAAGDYRRTSLCADPEPDQP
ncbi:MAG TPA: hypothetical protein VHB47_26375 [Thermoanaerobaculia bacterium]|nr:hypothetical protein [Thermoanaerobaculia bacterium]